MGRSTDGGVTWQEITPSADEWRQIVASDDGLQLIALGEKKGPTVSNDGGVTWSNPFAASRSWEGLASSADGRVAIALNRASTNPGARLRVHVSTDYGASWNERTGVADVIVMAAAVSTNGERVFVAGDTRIWGSDDQGETWSEGVLPTTSNKCFDLSISNSGQFVSCAHGSVTGASPSLSHDGGETFFSRSGPVDGGGIYTGLGPVSSSWNGDGSLLALVAAENVNNQYRRYLSFSTDGGLTQTRVWTSSDVEPLNSNASAWVSVSADGSKVVVVPQHQFDPGSIYVSGTGKLTLPVNSSITLTYAGSNRFSVTETQGWIEAP